MFIDTNDNKNEQIVDYNQCEDWMIYNKYIKKGYRLNFNSFRKCIKSIFMIHNEFMNIWTHLLGFILFLIILILFYFEIVFNFKNKSFEKNKKNNLNQSSIYIFYISSLLCLFFSTFYHSFMCINQKMENKLHKFDFLGIFILIFGSCVPIYYISFYCNLKIFYIYIITTFLSCCAGYFVFFIKKLHSEKFKYLKFIIFIIVSLIITIPIIHILVNYYYFKVKSSLSYNQGYDYVVIHGLVYILGLTIYTLKMPERFFTNKFNNFFNSHNIWHIMILIACFINYLAVNKLFKNRENILCIIN